MIIPRPWQKYAWVSMVWMMVQTTPATAQDSIKLQSEGAVADSAEPVSVAPPTQKPPGGCLLHPYYFSAYVPAAETTELNLGLNLSNSPGIEAAVAWGAGESMLLGAKINGQGASSTTGIRFQYALNQPSEAAWAPAILMGWRIADQRQDTVERVNIFRGNRWQAGMILSRSLEGWARSLQVSKSLADFIAALQVHAAAVVEYQNGRMGSEEAALSRLQAGLRLGVEAALAPGQWYLNFMLDTLPDWLDRSNYYAGLRYYTRETFGFDFLIGVLGGQSGAVAGLFWVF